MLHFQKFLLIIFNFFAMDEVKKTSLLSQMTPKQTFVVGLVGGLMTLCTIGFFILLALVLNGKIDDLGDGLAATTPVSAGPSLIGVAKDLKLNMNKFKECVKTTKFSDKVQADEQDGAQAGAQGTPYSLAVGPKGQVIPIGGAYPFQVVEGIIKQFKGEKVVMPEGSELPKEEKGIVFRPVDVDKEIVRGNPNAQITIIEYTDLECPFCKRFHQTMQQVLATYSDDIRVILRHFPLDSLHKKARTEANAVECAGEQGKFWEFVDGIFKVTPSNDGMDITI